MAGEHLGEIEQAVWEGFLRTHEQLHRALSAGLASIDISVAEFDFLLDIDNSGTDGTRMSDLAERRPMSSGGCTRLADRLERRGLIERRRSSSDGRSLEAAMTADGRALLARAQRQHQVDLRVLFFDHLDDGRLRRLASVWRILGDDEPTNEQLLQTLGHG